MFQSSPYWDPHRVHTFSHVVYNPRGISSRFLLLFNLSVSIRILLRRFHHEIFPNFRRLPLPLRSWESAPSRSHFVLASNHDGCNQRRLWLHPLLFLSEDATMHVLPMSHPFKLYSSSGTGLSCSTRLYLQVSYIHMSSFASKYIATDHGNLCLAIDHYVTESLLCTSCTGFPSL